MEKVSTAKVICGGGLNKKDNWIELSDQTPGQAVQLVNFEPSLFGGYRRISGYQPLNMMNSVVPGEGKILGIFFYNNQILAARKDVGADTYSVYEFVVGGPWSIVSTGYSPSSLGVNKIRYDTFNFDGTPKIVFVDGVNAPVCYDGTAWTVLTGDQLEDNGSTLTPKFVAVFKNHVFVSGDPNYPHLVIHSAPNNETDWTAANGSGQIVAGFSVVQIEPFRDRLIVFGLIEIKYIAASGTTFVIDGITKNLGCISSDSVVEANGDLLFLSHDGVRPISATERNEDFELSSISKNIQELFNLSNFPADLENINAATIRRKSQVRFFLTQETLARESAKGLLVGLMSSSEGPRWEWSELRGIKVSCVSSGYLDGAEMILHGGFDGVVYRQEIGSSFAGDNIPAMYSTPYLDYGDPMLRKTLKSVKVFFRPEGQMDIAMGIGYDWGDEKNMNNLSPDYLLEGMGDISYWNQAVYNQSRFSSLPLPFTFRNITGSGFSNRFVFACENTLPSFSIQSIIVEITPNGQE